MMNDPKSGSEDPYRSPHEVAEPKSLAKKKWGWGRFLVVGFLLLALGMAGLLTFATTATFNMQRARPNIRAPKAGVLDSPVLEQGPSATEDEIPSGTVNTQNP